ncbi:Apoptosis-inducing factor B [Choanephora cucurbitarum]|uniref:Apoptosis-inducing factor B n=1 Tax=Choanephora cucurbitarum TaxID=101091 RepID=A0A1C7NG29_9FUNG|nr:Apoptosis-inducing factor B [Choanephora cucurbitarum]
MESSLIEFELKDVLQDPILLNSFEGFLTTKGEQKNLFFIEAMNQLRHEVDSSKEIEDTLYRIYTSFIKKGSLLQIDITTRQSVESRIQSSRWATLDQEEATDILRETEHEVMAILSRELDVFLSASRHDGSLRRLRVNNGPTNSLQKRVLIVGGGFTGFTVASILDPMPLFHVTLIDTKDSFEYTPQILSKIANPKQSSSLRFPHSSYVKNGKVIIGYAEDICQDAKCVKVNSEEIGFDYLVVAPGSSYAGQFKSTDHSSLYRATGLKKIADDILSAKNILIIGAGLVGCELAATIAQQEHHPKKKVLLVESQDKIIPRSSEKQRKKAMEYLAGLGVEVILNERITFISMDEADTYHGSSGRVYSSRDYTVLMATGVRVNSGFVRNSTNTPSLETCVDNYGLIRVRPTLQIAHWKYNHIFAGGDATNVIEEKTAYAATIAGVCIARNICRLEKGKEPIEQGHKGLLAPPLKTLHGIKSQGGIGKKPLSFLERKLSFLNPTWQILKFFNEQQFFDLVQKTSRKSSLIGRIPRTMQLPKQHTNALHSKLIDSLSDHMSSDTSSCGNSQINSIWSDEMDQDVLQ